MKRKMLASILALAMMLTMLPATAWAAEAADSGEAAAEAEPIAPAEEPEEPEQPEAALLQARIDALPEADEVAALMESDPAAVDAVYEEVRALMEAVEALDGALDTARLDALVALFTPEAELLAGEECDGGEACQQHEAAIGSKHYDTLAAAVSAVKGQTVTLLKDAEVTTVQTIGKNKVCTIDLNNHNIEFEAGCYFLINSNGTLKLIGKGKLYEKVPNNSPIVVNGTISGKTTLNVGEHVTLEGWAGVFVNSSRYNTNIVVNVAGTVIGCTDVNGKNGAGIYVNGNIKGTSEKTAAQVTLTETAKVSGTGCGILAAGYAKWNITGSEITGPTGIEIRAGEMNISGDAKITGTASPLRVTPNGSGGTTIGAGIAVAQHTTKLPIKVNIAGGVIKGYSALYESNPQKNQDTDLAKITLDVKGGEFEAINSGTQAVFSEDKENFITSGTFSSDVIEYVADGYATSQESNHYIVGPLSAENAAAKITNGETTTYYATLAKAVAAANDDETVTLMKDVNITKTLTIDKTVTLDLAGNTITGPKFEPKDDEIEIITHPMITVADGGNLSLTTSKEYGTLDCNNGPEDAIAEVECVSVNEGGTCAITGITICNAGTAIANHDGAITEITNCTIDESGYGIYTSGTIETITGTTITNNTNGALYIANGTGSVIELSGNNFTSEVDAIFCAGSVTITDGIYTSTGGNALEASSGTATVNGGTFTSGDDAAAYSEAELIINGGDFSGGNGADALDCDLDWGGSIEVTGGYFTSDPGEYVAEGKTAIASDKSGYLFMVGDKEAGTIVEKPATADPEVKLDKIPEEERITVQAAAESVDAAEAIETAAREEELPDAVKTEATAAAEEMEKNKGQEAFIYKQTYLEITPTAYTTDGNTTTLTMDITPVMQAIVSTAKTANGIVLEGDGQNAVEIGTAMPLTITTPTQITVTLPAAFAGQTVYIKHEAASGTYFYTGTADENGVLTFTSQHGFSPFTFSTVNEAVAQVGSIGYPTFQAAVDAVQEGETVQILKASAEGYSASAEKTVTVENLSGSELQVTCSGETAAIPAGESHTFTYVAPTPVWPPYVPPIIPVVPAQPAAPASELPFVDVSVQDAFYEAVKYVYDNGLMTGVDTTVFAPYGDFTRAQVATILFRLEAEPVTPFAAIFPDVTEGQWFAQAITWGNSKSILLGYDDGTFGPDNAVTMEQLLTILYRYAGLKGYDTEARADITGFDCADYADEAVSWAAAHGMVDASNATTLRATAARWQVAQVLSVFCQTVVLR